MCHFSIAHKVSHGGQDIFKLMHDTLPVRIFPDGSVPILKLQACCNPVARLSTTTLLQGCHKVAKTMELKLLQPCCKIVARLLQGCGKVAVRL